jgi:peptidyl-Lys metalloendopeptidase
LPNDDNYVEVATSTTNATEGSNVDVFLSMDGPPICPDMTDAEFRKTILKLRDDAIILIDKRLSELRRWSAADRYRVNTWFGTTDESTRQRVSSGLTKVEAVMRGLKPNNFIRSSPDLDRAVGCTPNMKNLSGEVAHVCGPDTATHTISISVNFCGLPDKSAGTLDSKMATIIHESTHFLDTIGTGDHAYGQFLCKRLAVENPALAINNADSFAWYVARND